MMTSQTLLDCPWKTCSPSGRKLLNELSQFSKTALPIYLLGETGTGKEVLAHWVHAQSPRAQAPFVALNCGSVSENLAESELFGHVRGAFTGALTSRAGACIAANGGTLFLDEVGDLSAELQVKLLRFLESGEVRPVGSDRSLKSDVRILSASHKNLARLVREGTFRQDLFFRLTTLSVVIPALRQRPDDVALLAAQYATELRNTLTSEATAYLMQCAWPGNVRELKHTLQRASVLNFPRTVMDMDCFSAGDPLLAELAGSAISSGPAADTRIDPPHSPRPIVASSIPNLHQLEKEACLRALEISNGNRVRAASLLGVARSTLFEMLKRHEITITSRIH